MTETENQQADHVDGDGSAAPAADQAAPVPGLRDWLIAVTVVLAVAALVAAIFWPRTERLPDFAAIEDIDEMKRTFFAHLAPAVQAENRRVLDQRERLLGIIEDFDRHGAIRSLDRRWLKRLAEEYGLEWDGEQPSEKLPETLPETRAENLAETLKVLKRRVDIVPVSLALVQAATESGWGRSRFAVEGNNLFGQWCYRQGCGLVPDNRPPGASHEVAAFDSVRDAVTSYLRNLNTHDAYRPLRELRAGLRAAGQTPHAHGLVDGLILYSERREEYLEEIRMVLRVNQPIIEEVVTST